MAGSVPGTRMQEILRRWQTRQVVDLNENRHAGVAILLSHHYTPSRLAARFSFGGSSNLSPVLAEVSLMLTPLEDNFVSEMGKTSWTRSLATGCWVAVFTAELHFLSDVFNPKIGREIVTNLLWYLMGLIL